MQLLNDLPEQAFVFWEKSHRKCGAVGTDPVLLEQGLYLRTGKMHPEYLGLILQIVAIFLGFSGSVENHGSGGIYPVLPFKLKMGFSRSYIEKLIVKPSVRAGGDEYGELFQPIFTAAADHQRPGFIHKGAGFEILILEIVQISGIEIHGIPPLHGFIMTPMQGDVKENGTHDFNFVHVLKNFVYGRIGKRML